MPEIRVWPVSSSVRTWKVGSSSARRASATPIFSWSALVFGSIETCMTGSGNVDRLEHDRRVGRAQRVAGRGLLEADGRRRCRPRRSPRCSSRWFACIIRMRPTRSVRPVIAFSTRPPALELAGVDAEVGELADVRVGHDLEGERRERARRRRRRAWPACPRLVLGRARGPRPAARRAGSAGSRCTASSSGCTPLFLKLEPHSTGVIVMSSVALRIAALRRSTSIASSAR